METLRLFGFDEFNAEEYWGSRAVKKWVVILYQTTRINGKKIEKRDLKLVAAKTREGALKTARANSHLTGRTGANCRLAHPEDLGCIKVQNSPKE